MDFAVVIILAEGVKRGRIHRGAIEDPLWLADHVYFVGACEMHGLQEHVIRLDEIVVVYNFASITASIIEAVFIERFFFFNCGFNKIKGEILKQKMQQQSVSQLDRKRGAPYSAVDLMRMMMMMVVVMMMKKKTLG